MSGIRFLNQSMCFRFFNVSCNIGDVEEVEYLCGCLMSRIVLVVVSAITICMLQHDSFHA